MDFANRMALTLVNPFFKKKERRITYNSGGRATHVDYFLCRRHSLKEIGDYRVIVGECSYTRTNGSI